MKKIFLLTLFVNLCLLGFSQKVSYDDVINKKVKGPIEKYITRQGEEFSIGDTITLGVSFRNEQFDYIQQSAAGMAYYPINNDASGSIVVIKSIKVRSKLVYVNTTKPQGYAYGLMISNLDGAIENGEIKSKIMTSDQALSELKKWKDKLDLELISQEEYETKKKELSKYIK